MTCSTASNSGKFAWGGVGIGDTYGNVSPEDVPVIISEHLVNGRIVNGLVVAKL